MSCNSVPKRLVQIVFGGSVVWLGITFSSPLAAIEPDLAPTSVNAPELLAAPYGSVTAQSDVPATDVEVGETDCWDTGPVDEAEACDDELAGNGKSFEEYYDDCEYGDDYGYPEEQYADNVATDPSPADSEETPCADDSWYADDPCFDAEDDDYDIAADETDEPSADSGEWDWEQYVYEDEYGYGSDEQAGSDANQPEIEEMTAEDPAEDEIDGEGAWADEYSYEYDDYGYDDGSFDQELTASDSATESVAEEEVQEETIAEEAWADEYSYEYDDYGYDDEGFDQELTESDSADESVAEEEVQEEAIAEEASADEYEYGMEEHDTYDYDANDYGYEYEYDYEYDMGDAYSSDTLSEEPVDTAAEEYDVAEPDDSYSYEYGTTDEWPAEEEEETDSGISSRHPADLLKSADCELLRSLERLSTEPAAARRARLNDYIEALGFEAIDFAYRFEDATDSDVLNLADDLPGAAAFLATYRLVEGGDVAMDKGVTLLEETLSDLSLDWIEETGRIAASEKDATIASHPVVSAMVAAMNHSLVGAGAVAEAISERLSAIPWSELSTHLEELHSALRPINRDEDRTY